MDYVKAVAAGLVSAVVFVAAAVGISVMRAVLPVTDSWAAGEGSGGIGAVSVGISELLVLVAAALGFATGFFLMLRRARARAL